MPFAASLSVLPGTLKALDEACTPALGKLQGTPDLAMLFYSAHHADEAVALAGAAQERLGARTLLGCPGEAIVGNDREVENGPALSLWVGRWNPGVTLTPFHLTLEQTSDGPSLLGWPDVLADIDTKDAFILMVADPFTFPADEFLRQVNENHPGLRVMGGMASGGRQPGENPMIYGGRCVEEGAIGVVVQGAAVRSVVSQGCRPIGRHLVVTKAQDNIIVELGGQPAMAQIQRLWQELSPADQELVRQGLHVGRVINEYQESFQRGDFLVRNVIGIDRSSGALAITDRVRVGQTVQFHVRDAATADEDLHELLKRDRAAHAQPPGGALLFSCNGRGTRLFDTPHHDARAVRGETGELPLAGFFAMGELGPVGGQNFVHGFTASVVLFEV